jgi:hypothetical protein
MRSKACIAKNSLLNKAKGKSKWKRPAQEKPSKTQQAFRCDADSESGSSTENDSQQNSPINNEKCQRTGYPSGYQSEEL